MKVILILTCFLSAVFGISIHSFDDFETVQASDNGEKHWALIIAGSKGWMNYRHQVM